MVLVLIPERGEASRSEERMQNAQDNDEDPGENGKAPVCMNRAFPVVFTLSKRVHFGLWSAFKSLCRESCSLVWALSIVKANS